VSKQTGKVSTPAAELKVEQWAIGKLRPYPGNPRQNLQTIDKVVASLEQFGWRQPIVVDESGEIIVGHTRYMAAQRMRLRTVPVHVAVGLTPEKVRAYRLADNRIADESEWDQDLLAVELSELLKVGADLSTTGFSAFEVDDLLEALEEGTANTPDPDAAPPVPKTPRTRLGDVWILGNHRLRCGDSRRLEDMRSATDNRLVDIVWTDPPYNVAYFGKGKDTKHLSIKNDKMDDGAFAEFLIIVNRNMFKMMKPGAPIYIAHAATEALNFLAASDRAGFKVSGTLIWRKDSMVLGHSDYQWQHEPILYGWKPGKSHPWFGDRKQVTMIETGDGLITQLGDGRWQVTLGDRLLVFTGEATLEEFSSSLIEIDRPTKSTLHPTMKPTALIERLLKNSAKPGQLVLDCFGGSGSTLIAAERLGMHAALVELDPAYCDVIVQRWEEYTKRQAVRDGDGVHFGQAGARSRVAKTGTKLQKSVTRVRKPAAKPPKPAPRPAARPKKTAEIPDAAGDRGGLVVEPDPQALQEAAAAGTFDDLAGVDLDADLAAATGAQD
jgi:DNA modification methylase